MSFPYTFAEEAFLGRRMKDDVGTVLIPLKRSVISLQVVRKPLVPYFPGRAAEHCWWREGGGQGLKSTPARLLVLRRLLLSYQVSRGSLEGKSLSCWEPSRVQVMLQETFGMCLLRS